MIIICDILHAMLLLAGQAISVAALIKHPHPIVVVLSSIVVILGLVMADVYVRDVRQDINNYLRKKRMMK